MEKKYIVTKQACEEGIQKRGSVCEYCGRTPIALETVDNANNPTHWAGCYHTDNVTSDSWGVFTCGVDPEVYKLAVNLVLEDGDFRVSRRELIENEDHFEYKFREAVAKTSRCINHIEAVKVNGARYTKDSLKSLFLPQNSELLTQ